MLYSFQRFYRKIQRKLPGIELSEYPLSKISRGARKKNPFQNFDFLFTRQISLSELAGSIFLFKKKKNRVDNSVFSLANFFN